MGKQKSSSGFSAAAWPAANLQLRTRGVRKQDVALSQRPGRGVATASIETRARQPGHAYGTRFQQQHQRSKMIAGALLNAVAPPSISMASAGSTDLEYGRGCQTGVSSSGSSLPRHPLPVDNQRPEASYSAYPPLPVYTTYPPPPPPAAALALPPGLSFQQSILPLPPGPSPPLPPPTLPAVGAQDSFRRPVVNDLGPSSGSGLLWQVPLPEYPPPPVPRPAWITPQQPPLPTETPPPIPPASLLTPQQPPLPLKTPPPVPLPAQPPLPLETPPPIPSPSSWLTPGQPSTESLTGMPASLPPALHCGLPSGRTPSSAVVTPLHPPPPPPPGSPPGHAVASQKPDVPQVPIAPPACPEVPAQDATATTRVCLLPGSVAAKGCPVSPDIRETPAPVRTSAAETPPTVAVLGALMRHLSVSKREAKAEHARGSTSGVGTEDCEIVCRVEAGEEGGDAEEEEGVYHTPLIAKPVAAAVPVPAADDAHRRSSSAGSGSGAMTDELSAHSSGACSGQSNSSSECVGIDSSRGSSSSGSGVPTQVEARLTLVLGAAGRKGVTLLALDTNVWLHRLGLLRQLFNSLFDLDDKTKCQAPGSSSGSSIGPSRVQVLVPKAVMAELDKHKTNPLLGGLARDASRLMEDLQHRTGGLGLKLEQGSAASRDRHIMSRLEERMEELQHQLAWMNPRAPGRYASHRGWHAGPSYRERQAWDQAFDMLRHIQSQLCQPAGCRGDDAILQCCQDYMDRGWGAALATDDRNLRIRARDVGLCAVASEELRSLVQMSACYA